MNTHTKPSPLTRWLPTPGNLLFTLLIAALLYAHQVNAFPAPNSNPPTQTQTSSTTLPYQGRLTDPNGNPINATQAMTFRLYNVVSGGTALWQESWPAVQVSDGLFNVLLGSTTPIAPTLFRENNSLWLGVTVGTDTEMTPRVQVGSVPFAMRATTADEMNYELSLTSTVATTSTISADFGVIDLPTTSNLHIASMWILQNNSSGLGFQAYLKIDGLPYQIYGDVIPLSSPGIGFTIARNHYIQNLAPGNHSISVQIEQFPGRSGDAINIVGGSKIWIRAVPTIP